MPDNAQGWSVAPCWGVDLVLIGCRIFRQVFGREGFASELIAKHRTLSVQRKPHAIISPLKTRNLKARSAYEFLWVTATVTPRIFINTKTFVRYVEIAPDVS